MGRFDAVDFSDLGYALLTDVLRNGAAGGGMNHGIRTILLVLLDPMSMLLYCGEQRGLARKT